MTGPDNPATRSAAALSDYAAQFNESYTNLLHGALDGAPERIASATRHGALNGGKRLRPYLVETCAGLFGEPGEKAFLAASALECIHCYSLVHDDLPAMDDDDLRRGQPTVHVAYDEATAILAGDTLLTMAFEFLARIDPASHARSLSRTLSIAAGAHGMIGGQMLDLEAEGRFADGAPQHRDIDSIRNLQAMKTGALIRAGCAMGAMVADAPTDDQQALESYGAHLGFAFQIADDLLDHLGDSAALGKAAGKDAAAGKATIVGLMGVEAAKTKLSETVTAAQGTLARFGDAAKPLHDLALFVAQRKA